MAPGSGLTNLLGGLLASARLVAMNKSVNVLVVFEKKTTG